MTEASSLEAFKEQLVELTLRQLVLGEGAVFTCTQHFFTTVVRNTFVQDLHMQHGTLLTSSLYPENLLSPEEKIELLLLLLLC